VGKRDYPICRQCGRKITKDKLDGLCAYCRYKESQAEVLDVRCPDCGDIRPVTRGHIRQRKFHESCGCLDRNEIPPENVEDQKFRPDQLRLAKPGGSRFARPVTAWVQCPKCGENRKIKYTARASLFRVRKRHFKSWCMPCAGNLPKVVKHIKGKQETINGCSIIPAKEGTRCWAFDKCRHGYWAPVIDVPKNEECLMVTGLKSWAGFKCSPDSIPDFMSAEEKMVVFRVQREGREFSFHEQIAEESW
jgi:ssDNA-binding Zn-finger/Zn-ribbon topoisomerase 1